MKRLSSLLVAIAAMLPLSSAQGQQKLTREQLVNFPKTITKALDYPAGWQDNNNIILTTSVNGSRKNVLYNIKTKDNSQPAAKPATRTLPPQIAGAKNVTFSPDSSKVAYTKENDLYYKDLASGKEYRLTHDGSELTLNGYASWVYYEEILGRSSRYKAFWWSPDSRKIGYYKFDNSEVPMFPIYNAKGHEGTLSRTRYPKAGATNPKVKIGIIDLASADLKTIWGDFNENEDQYFGIPFWSSNSETFIVPWMPRVQNTMYIYALDYKSGSKKKIYTEEQPTWIDWLKEVVFTDAGMYMVRDYELWQQIYFLSYDGQKFEKLSNGNNWGISILKLDEKNGVLFYSAKNEDITRTDLFKIDLKKKNVQKISFGDYAFSSIYISPDNKKYTAIISNYKTPSQLILAKIGKKVTYEVLQDSKGPDFDKYKIAEREIIKIKTDDGYTLPCIVTYPVDLDRNHPTKKYPVIFHIYGGPDSPQVSDRWSNPSQSNQWWANEGVIVATIDSRSAGHNGKKGMNTTYGHMGDVELADFVLWAKYFKALPYVDGDKIGITGFSFGGTMTSRAVLTANEYFKYGIAGGGVYDWMLYDSHYTERYMNTPQNNPEGYKNSAVIYKVADSDYPGDETSMLRITHGTSDDNVHFQNTLQLITELQRANKMFELMIYPGAFHGYGGFQGTHSYKQDMTFWYRYLLGTTPPEILFR